jgi:1-carboxybiuret hydrolase subunit AtzG-like protein
MTRRPKKKPAARKAAKVVKRVKPAKRARPHPLDPFIAAGARALELKIDKAWLPAVRSHLEVTLHHGALVAGFALPDETDPAPVFEA